MQLQERGSGRGNCIRPTSKHQEVSIGSTTQKQTENSPSPLPCSSLPSISIGGRRCRESPAVLGGEISRGTQRIFTVKHQEVSFGCDGKQSKQNTHLPLVSLARYCRYRPGGEVGRRWRRGGRGPKEGMLAMSLPIGQGGSDARRAAAAERGRGKNGRIMDGRGPGVDGWRKRRWRREDGGCDASDSSSW